MSFSAHLPTTVNVEGLGAWGVPQMSLSKMWAFMSPGPVLCLLRMDDGQTDGWMDGCRRRNFRRSSQELFLPALPFFSFSFTAERNFAGDLGERGEESEWGKARGPRRLCLQGELMATTGRQSRSAQTRTAWVQIPLHLLPVSSRVGDLLPSSGFCFPTCHRRS